MYLGRSSLLVGRLESGCVLIFQFILFVMFWIMEGLYPLFMAIDSMIDFSFLHSTGLRL
jgi:hypothetical protein